MRFRLTALGLHLLASACVLTLVLGVLYLGWYRWPGWYLANVSNVVWVLACVDVALGPLLTFVVAAPGKPRRELKRDIGIIATVQIVALLYGAWTLWNGRPLYYAFSENVLQIVQSYDIEAPERALGLAQNPSLTPHWYSRPRWIWAPLPEDAAERTRIMTSAIMGGSDVVAMPRYYRPWAAGAQALRSQLKRPEELKRFFALADLRSIEARMHSLGLATDQPNSIVLLGRGTRMLAVFDPASLTLLALLATPLPSIK